MVSSLATSSLVLALCASASKAASLPKARQTSPHGFTLKATGSLAKNHVNLASAASGSGGNTSSSSLSDIQDLLYMVDIVLGGQQFTVQFDTGSSDLWVIAPTGTSINLVNTTDIIADETYGAGEATGPISFAELQLGGYTVPSQAFVNAQTAQDFGFTSVGGQGILGLAFDDVITSPVNFLIKQAYGNDSILGRTPISNIFNQNPTSPNSFDVQLDRTSDLDDTSTGTFLIGEHLPEFSNVTSQTKLARQFAGRWTVTLDDMAVNGKSAQSLFPKSSLPTVPSGKIGVLLDTGFSFPPLPPALIDAIYGSIPGAVPISGVSTLQWIVPCDGVTQVTFKFGGVDFPVHPLDLTVVDQTTITQNGQDTNVTYCYNAFQYLSLNPDAFEGFDGILGDAFLRNAYVSFDYGDTDSTGNQAFVQMLPTTTFDAAIPDFKGARTKALAALPPTIDPATFLQIINGDNSTSNGSSVKDASGAAEASTPSPSSDSASTDKIANWLDKYGPIIIGLLAGNVLIGAVLCIIGLVACLRGVVRGGAKTRSIGASYTPVRSKEAEAAYSAPSYHD